MVTIPPTLDTSTSSSGTLTKDIIEYKGRVKNGRNGWAIGAELLGFSVIVSEIYRFHVCKDTTSITQGISLNLRHCGLLRCTVALR